MDHENFLFTLLRYKTFIFNSSPPHPSRLILTLKGLRKYVIPFRSSHQRCSVKKVFLEISQKSQENTCARQSPFFNRVAGLSLF